RGTVVATSATGAALATDVAGRTRRSAAGVAGQAHGRAATATAAGARGTAVAALAAGATAAATLLRSTARTAVAAGLTGNAGAAVATLAAGAEADLEPDERRRGVHQTDRDGLGTGLTALAACVGTGAARTATATTGAGVIDAAVGAAATTAT